VNDAESNVRTSASSLSPGSRRGWLRGASPCLLILGIGMIILGLWRLYVWQFGAPEELFHLPTAAGELAPQRIDERIARQKKAIEKAHDAGKDGKAQQEILHELQAGREEWVAQWQREVSRARWKELRNGVGLLLLAGIPLSAGWRRFRSW
jgi:hypothetical protein